MPNAQEVRDLLEYASQLPWAPSRSAQIAQAAMWADALEGETDLKIDAYLELTMSYQQGNEEWKALAPLSTLLNMFEKNPADFDADLGSTRERSPQQDATPLFPASSSRN